ncbi:hypothetical protein ABZP36_002271 [Zizania latifolia]
MSASWSAALFRIGDTRRNSVKVSSKRANEFGIKVGSHPTTVKARVLQAPELVYKNFRKFRPVCGEWNMKNKAFANLRFPIFRANSVHIKDELNAVYQEICKKNVLNLKIQFLANVALKINAKAGGRNTVFAVRSESLPVVSNKPTIIFGAGVTHPGALDDSSPSIASVTKYNSVVRAQGHRVEIISDLEGIVRDGVSEGQFKQAWKGLYNDKAQITFVVVQKRHHTRLFPYGKGSENVLPGENSSFFVNIA